MKDRRIAATAALLVTLGVLGAPAASATTRTHTAPYDAADSDTRCITHDGAICRHEATSSGASGEIGVSAELEVPALTTASGLAQAMGNVSDTVRTPVKAKTLRVTATVAVAWAAASLSSAPTTTDDRARTVLELILFVWCSACPGGFATVNTPVTLVDTDPNTAAPSSVESQTRTLTAEFTLGSGQKFNGNASATLQATSQGGLGYQFLSPNRVATSGASVDVLKFEAVTS